MSIVQFLRILMARKWIIIVAFLSCFLVATVVANLLPKRYEASARVLLDVIRPDPVTGEVISSQFFRSYARTQMELVRDYRVTGDVVDRLNLTSNPQFVASYVEAGSPGNDLRRWIAQQIGDNISSYLIDPSNILAITYTAPDPELAKQVVEQVRLAYVETSLRSRTDSAGRNADWYRDQASRAQRQLQTAETALSDYLRQNNIILVGETDSETARLQELSNALATARGTVASADVAAATQLSANSAASGLELQLSLLNDQISQASAQLGVNHPTYKALLQRRASLQADIARAQSQSRAGVGALSSSTRQNVAQLQALYDAQQKKVLANRDKIDRVALLQREVELRRQLFEKAAARTAEFRMQSDVSDAGLTILGEPDANPEPIWPKIPTIIFLAAAFGLGLGVVASLVTEFLARRVRGPEDLSFATGVPVMAVVSSRERAPLREAIKRLLSRRRRGPSGDMGELQAAE